MVDEDGGSAVLTVQLQNEIERDFTISYATGQLPGGATGMYMHRHNTKQLTQQNTNLMQHLSKIK